MIASLDELAYALGRAQALPFRKNPLTTIANGYTSLFLAAGVPGPGQTPTTLAGAFPTNESAGAFRFADPLGAEQSQIGRLSAVNSVAGVLVIYDRIWHNAVQPNITSKQNIVFPTGAQRYGDGHGVELWAEVYAALGNTSAATWTAEFADQDGAAKTATLAYGSSGAAGRMIPFDLPAGCTGVRAVSSFQTNVSHASGQVGLLMLRRLAEIPLAIGGAGVAQDGISLGLPQVQPGAFLGMLIAHSASASSGQLFGRMDLVQG